MPNKTFIKVSGTWKEVVNVWRKKDGTWQPGIIPWIKANNIWYFCFTGAGYSHQVRLDTAENTICAKSFTTVFSSTETLAQGNTVYANPTLTTLVTGFTWITLGFDVHRLNSTTGVIGTKSAETTCGS